MAASASLHRNLLLLAQVVQPNEEFKKHFREGMFDKPNTAGFLHISYYLLTVYDFERFKKLIEWPVTCKKSEAKYRNNVKDYITIISAENPDIGFPNILMSHLIHAGGNKFTIIMWKLSQVVLRRYITRETTYDVIRAPQVGSNGTIIKQFFHVHNARVNANILQQHNNLLEIQNATKFALGVEKEKVSKIKSEIFEKELLLKSLSCKAPVHSSIKKCLRDINNEEVIKMWKKNISDGINRIQEKNKILKDMEQFTSRLNSVIHSCTKNLEILNAKQLHKINSQEISDLFSLDMQCLLFQLHKNDAMLLNNFIRLFNFLLAQLHQRLKFNMPEDISNCLLQIEASCKDMKSALNVIQLQHLDIVKMMSAAQNILYEKDVQIHDDTVLPIMNNVLIMLSPLIKIDTNGCNKEGDLEKRLQLTPVEAAHKSLFSRYQRLKENHASLGSKLRENLLVSRINFDDTIPTINNERHMPAMSNKKNLTSHKQAEKKYSRLFSTRTRRINRTVGANSSIISIPCFSKANSTTIASAIEEVHDISEFSLNVSTKSLCNASMEFATSEKLTTVQDKGESAEKSETEDEINCFPRKTNVLNICETIEVERKNNYDNNLKIQQTKQNRLSIGDLVERYKKILEVSNQTQSPK